MTTPNLVSYHHTQRAPWCLLLFASAAMVLTLGWVLRREPTAPWAFPLCGAILFYLGLSFRDLTVADEGAQLAIRFGPFPLFQKRIWYEDIRGVEKWRLAVLEGWGIQPSLRGGWVWSIWGLDCVMIRLKRGVIRVGTDDADNLVRFLKSRIPESAD